MRAMYIVKGFYSLKNLRYPIATPGASLACVVGNFLSLREANACRVKVWPKELTQRVFLKMLMWRY